MIALCVRGISLRVHDPESQWSHLEVPHWGRLLPEWMLLRVVLALFLRPGQRQVVSALAGCVRGWGGFYSWSRAFVSTLLRLHLGLVSFPGASLNWGRGKLLSREELKNADFLGLQKQL